MSFHPNCFLRWLLSFLIWMLPLSYNTFSNLWGVILFINMSTHVMTYCFSYCNFIQCLNNYLQTQIPKFLSLAQIIIQTSSYACNCLSDNSTWTSNRDLQLYVSKIQTLGLRPWSQPVPFNSADQSSIHLLSQIKNLEDSNSKHLNTCHVLRKSDGDQSLSTHTLVKSLDFKDKRKRHMAFWQKR